MDAVRTKLESDRPHLAARAWAVLTLLVLCVALRGPGQAFADSAAGLEANAAAWGIYIDTPGQVAGGTVANVAAPGPGGTALQVALNGCRGETATQRALDPRCAYTGLHAYTTLPVTPLTSTVTLSVDWYMDTPTLAPVQAVEFSLSTWLGGRRWEWALQWEHVGDGTARQGTLPAWRLWDGSRWQDIGITQPLATGTWHHLALQGEVQAGQVHYLRFSSDGHLYPLGQLHAPTAGGGSDRTTIALQVDGNYEQDPYACDLQHVTLSTT